MMLIPGVFVTALLDPALMADIPPGSRWTGMGPESEGLMRPATFMCKGQGKPGGSGPGFTVQVGCLRL